MSGGVSWTDRYLSNWVPRHVWVPRRPPRGFAQAAGCPARAAPTHRRLNPSSAWRSILSLSSLMRSLGMRGYRPRLRILSSCKLASPLKWGATASRFSPKVHASCVHQRRTFAATGRQRKRVREPRRHCLQRRTAGTEWLMRLRLAEGSSRRTARTTRVGGLGCHRRLESR